MTNQPNREPRAHVNCSAHRRTCREPVTVREPVPLCRNHAIEIALATVPAVLGAALANSEPRTSSRTSAREPMQTIRLRRGERTAIEALVASRTAITRRTVADAIRTAGGSCSNQ